MKLGLKFPLLKNKTLELKSGREQPLTHSGLKVSESRRAYSIEGILAHIHVGLHPHHHMLGILWFQSICF